MTRFPGDAGWWQAVLSEHADHTAVGNSAGSPTGPDHPI